MYILQVLVPVYVTAFCCANIKWGKVSDWQMMKLKYLNVCFISIYQVLNILLLGKSDFQYNWKKYMKK